MRAKLSLLGLSFAMALLTAPTVLGQSSVSGTATYSGRQAGDVWLLAAPNLSNLSTNAPFKLRLSTPPGTFSLPFVLTNVFKDFDYHFFAWRDSDSNGTNNTREPRLLRPYGPFRLTNDLALAGVLLEDPDDDADGSPDWWEDNYGLGVEVGNGSSGPLSVRLNGEHFTDTTVASVTGFNPAGSALLNVSSTNGFASNDLVLVITMQDPSTNMAGNSAGKYEFGRIAALSGSGALTLDQPRSNSFSDASGARSQIIKVPEYTDVNFVPGLSLDGTDDYVDVPDGIWFSSASTVEAWVYVRTHNHYSRLVDFGNGPSSDNVILALSEGTSGRPVLATYRGAAGASLISPQPLPTHKWVHLAGVISNGVGVILVDGQRVVSGALPSPNPVNRIQNFIGRSAWATDGYANAMFVDFRIWKTARTDAQIRAAMRGDIAGHESGLLVRYQMEDGAGAILNDSGGMRLHATLMNGPSWALGQLRCHSWNGTNGGVLAFLARSIDSGQGGIITADGSGYRGGASVPSVGNWMWGMAGERITGNSAARESDSLERVPGGGGAGKGADASGGGGSHAGPGGSGDAALKPNSIAGAGATNLYGIPALARLYMGGGGGGSGSHDSGRIGVAGGSGGGIIFVSAGAIRGAGSISSRGAAGQPGVLAFDLNSGSGGGGGAGGSVYVMGSLAPSVRLNASGGEGGARHTSAANSKTGGAGGIGRIRVDLPPPAITITNASPPIGHIGLLPAGISVMLSAVNDADNDRLSDYCEYKINTNPLKPDTDGDTMPDWWENSYLLDPLNPADAAYGMDADRDMVPNLLELWRGTRPDLADTDDDGVSDYEELMVHQTNPLKQDTDDDGRTDWAELAEGTPPLLHGIRYFYDNMDRLVGAQYDVGLSLGYEYDRNANLVTQVYALNDNTTNGLPDVWEFIHGLTNATGFIDSDGDLWTDYQEWQAGTDPLLQESTPNVQGSLGTVLNATDWPFTPSAFVVGVGQLDGLGAEEIVIGADGNPGGATNFVLILTQTAAGWSTRNMEVGRFGVTSIAIGQPTNRPSSAIYLGLRQNGGVGRVSELAFQEGDYTMNPVVTNAQEAAYVLGVRAGRDLLISMAGPTNGSGNVYYAVYESDAWKIKVANNDSSSRGLGGLTVPSPWVAGLRGMRLLDSGGLQVIGEEGLVPTNAIWYANSRWFFLTPTNMTWDDSLNYARRVGGDLATVTDTGLNSWLVARFFAPAGPLGYWIGLSKQTCSDSWRWSSGAPVDYTSWGAGEPNCSGGVELVTHVSTANGAWNDLGRADVRPRGLVELAFNAPSIQAAEPLGTNRLLWSGQSLASANVRFTNSLSIFYTFVEDRNSNGLMDSGDDMLLAEYSYSHDTLTLNDLQRVPLSGGVFAQCYGLAGADVLFGDRQAFFTAAPDGRIYSWTATEGVTPLKRQLFSSHREGTAWHALVAVKTLEPAQTLFGLNVAPAAPRRCNLVIWPPVQNLPELATPPQTAPVTQILTNTGGGRDIARLDLSIWDAEGNSCLPELQFQLPGETLWHLANLTAINNGAYGYVHAPPAGRIHQLSWDAARDLGAGYTNTVALRARSRDVTLLGEWSPPRSYLIQNSSGGGLLAYDDQATTVQGMAVDIDVLSNDVVAGNATKQISSVGLPSHGSASVINQKVRYTPAPSFAGTDRVVYTLTDGLGSYSMATATITVTPGGQPIMLLSPTVRGGNQFSMVVTGPVGASFEVQISTDLTNWSRVTTLANPAGSVVFTADLSTNTTPRLYRAVRIIP